MAQGGLPSSTEKIRTDTVSILIVSEGLKGSSLHTFESMVKLEGKRKSKPYVNQNKEQGL